VEIGDQLHGALIVGIPMSLGLCPASGCGPAQAVWGPLCLGLLLVSAGFAIAGLRDRGDRIRQVTRLSLVVAAALTIFMYARSSAAGLAPLTNSRYLHPLLISLPAVLWPLWTGAAALVRRPRPVRRPRLALGGAAAVVLAGVVVTMLALTAGAIAGVPRLRAAYQDTYRLIGGLRALGVTRVYSDYGTCNQLTYFTGERVVCAAIVDDLHRGQDRYPPYRRAVADAAAPAFVVVAGSAMQVNLESRFAHEHTDLVGAQTIAGYRVYRPRGKVQPYEYE
jgi:hypothetical protein